MGLFDTESVFDGRARRENIFLAIRPPDDRRQEIDFLIGKMFEKGILRGPRVAQECLHISLYGLGLYPDLPDPLIANVCHLVSKLEINSFKVCLNRIMGFKNSGRRQPLVLTGDDGIIGVDQIYQALYELFFRARLIDCTKPSFRPHLTLSREDSVWEEDFIAPVTWWVTEFCLIHSPRGQGRHNVLHSWPLLPPRKY